jgi:hypothetical protein
MADAPRDCQLYHPCAVCRLLVLCKTTVDVCPWQEATRKEIDPGLLGGLCFDCMGDVLVAVMRRQNEIENDDGA